MQRKTSFNFDLLLGHREGNGKENGDKSKDLRGSVAPSAQAQCGALSQMSPQAESRTVFLGDALPVSRVCHRRWRNNIDQWIIMDYGAGSKKPGKNPT